MQKWIEIKAKEILKDWPNFCPPENTEPPGYKWSCQPWEERTPEKCEQCRMVWALFEASQNPVAYQIDSEMERTEQVIRTNFNRLKEDQISFMIVEDIGIWTRDILNSVYEKHYGYKFNFKGAVTRAQDAIWFVVNNKPDITILDISLNPITTNKEGLEIIQEIKQFTKVIVFTSLPDIELKGLAYEEGALHFLKKTEIKHLAQEMIKIMTGESYAIQESSQYRSNRRLKKREERLRMLSPAERRVYELWEKELKDEEIADEMNISIESVRNYKSSIKRSTKLELVILKELIRID